MSKKINYASTKPEVVCAIHDFIMAIEKKGRFDLDHAEKAKKIRKEKKEAEKALTEAKSRIESEYADKLAAKKEAKNAAEKAALELENAKKVVFDFEKLISTGSGKAVTEAEKALPAAEAAVKTAEAKKAEADKKAAAEAKKAEPAESDKKIQLDGWQAAYDKKINELSDNETELTAEKKKMAEDFASWQKPAYDILIPRDERGLAVDKKNPLYTEGYDAYVTYQETHDFSDFEKYFSKFLCRIGYGAIAADSTYVKKTAEAFKVKLGALPQKERDSVEGKDLTCVQKKKAFDKIFLHIFFQELRAKKVEGVLFAGADDLPLWHSNPVNCQINLNNYLTEKEEAEAEKKAAEASKK